MVEVSGGAEVDADEVLSFRCRGSGEVQRYRDTRGERCRSGAEVQMFKDHAEVQNCRIGGTGVIVQMILQVHSRYKDAQEQAHI